jgi:flagellar assembly factor FliW
MKVATARFGEIEVSEEQEIVLTQGLLGFDALTRFALLPHRGASGPFTWMQSLERPEVAFVLCAPSVFVPDYAPPLTDGMRGALSADPSDAVAIFTLVTFRDGGKRATTNLCAPLLVNVTKRLGRQVILDDGRYPLRHELFGGEAKGREGAA